MKNKKYGVNLTDGEEKELNDIVRKGSNSARKIMRARILLTLNESGGEGRSDGVMSQGEIAERCGCEISLVYRVGKQYVKEGIDRVLKRKKRETGPVPRKVTGDIEAKIIALSCSEPPAGYSRWTLRLMEERSKIELGIQLSDATIGNVLRNTALKPHQKKMLVHTAETKRGVCGGDGRRSGGVSAAL
jgi:transposase